MEVIDIGLNDLEPISISIDDVKPSTPSYGTGIELLMNDKKRASGMNINVDMSDINDLENELN